MLLKLAPGPDTLLQQASELSKRSLTELKSQAAVFPGSRLKVCYNFSVLRGCQKSSIREDESGTVGLKDARIKL